MQTAMWSQPVALRYLPPAPLNHARESEGCTESRLPAWCMMRLAEQLGGWQTAPSLAASPQELCLQNILSRGLLVMSPSLYQCFSLVQLYSRGAVSFHTSEPAESLPGVIVTSQQRFANRHLEIKSCCRAQGQ